MKRSAISVVEQNGKFLCVWNKRFGGWALPGGMVEENETMPQAQARELREETRLITLNRTLIYDAPFELPTNPGRSSHVHVFRVTTAGVAYAGEVGCPITWLTRDELLEQSPFTAFYRKMFDSLAS